MKGYKDLEVWKISTDLVIDVYRITSEFPNREIYGLTSQMRRAAISIPSNIAEGSGRKNPKEFIQFLYISKGSLSELETQIEIANRLDYVKETAEMYVLIKRIRMMIINLISYLKSSKRQNVKTT